MSYFLPLGRSGSFPVANRILVAYVLEDSEASPEAGYILSFPKLDP